MSQFFDFRKRLKIIFATGEYQEIYGFLQWLLRAAPSPLNWKTIDMLLEHCHSAYRIIDDGKTFAPISSSEDAAAVNRAFSDLAASEFHGARAHLRTAAEMLTEGNAADSIRESIHAVESVARLMGSKNSLAGALQKLKANRIVHPALERGFNSLYGFTSDEKGIRHPLLDDGDAKVDETDAMFMIGACSAFVSYLINRSKE